MDEQALAARNDPRDVASKGPPLSVLLHALAVSKVAIAKDGNMKVLDEIATLGLIKKQMRRSRTARLAVAFWGRGAARNLGISERRDCVEIICNLSQGGTNPDEIRTLMGLPQVGCDRIRQNDRLHAKVYLFDNLAIVGSSN